MHTVFSWFSLCTLTPQYTPPPPLLSLLHRVIFHHTQFRRCSVMEPLVAWEGCLGRGGSNKQQFSQCFAHHSAKHLGCVGAIAVPIQRAWNVLVLVPWGWRRKKNDDLEKTDWMKDKETISGAPEMKIWVAFPLTEFPYLLLILNENVTMSVPATGGGWALWWNFPLTVDGKIPPSLKPFLCKISI